MHPFKILMPETIRYPIVISLPHVGTAFPPEVSNLLKEAMLPPDDTDWHLDRLYDFANSMGIPLIHSVYSRWVIDLNRNPDSIPLYNDGRVITSACTTTNFSGNPIYKDERGYVPEAEVQERRVCYFDPYHKELEGIIQEVRNRFGLVLLWDGHSIRRFVPGISQTTFPDFIIGTNDDATIPKHFSGIVWNHLKAAGTGVAYNHPFKGGYITRHYGNPQEHRYAIQLEMCKDLYMNAGETMYDHNKAQQLQILLMEILALLGAALLEKATRIS